MPALTMVDAAGEAGDAAFIDDYLAQSDTAMRTFRADPAFRTTLGAMAALVLASLRDGGTLLVAGNGGSAGDAQHIAGEFTGRLMYDRPPLPAVALHVDTSALTAIANDYGFDHVYERQVLALGRPGDVLLALSTSGNSPNVLLAAAAARQRRMGVIGFTGSSGGALAQATDLVLQAPSALTPVVQQIHITAGHVLCALVERGMFPRGAAPA